MILSLVSVPQAGEPIEPKEGSLRAPASPLPAPPIIAPKAPGIPLGGDLNVISPTWVGDGRVSLQPLLWS